MRCDDCKELIGALHDDELDARKAEQVRAHLTECEPCGTAFEHFQTLRGAIRADIPRHKASDLLRARITRALRDDEAGSFSARARGMAQGGEASSSSERGPGAPPIPAREVGRMQGGGDRTDGWRWLAIAASVLCVVSLGYAARVTAGRTDASAFVTHDLLSSHVRSLMPGHLADVASTDQHNVKPWFGGRLDYSPTVYDLKADGFPLQGGRLDYVGTRPVAALIYGRRQHTINLYLWPAGSEHGPDQSLTENGYHMVHWTRDGMEYWAVSDLNMQELKEFAARHQALDDSLSSASEAGKPH
jgi:anti-sigma factor RsiW